MTRLYIYIFIYYLILLLLYYILYKYIYKLRVTQATVVRLLHIVRHRTAASAKCILGFIAIASTHEPPPMHAR